MSNASRIGIVRPDSKSIHKRLGVYKINVYVELQGPRLQWKGFIKTCEVYCLEGKRKPEG